MLNSRTLSQRRLLGLISLDTDADDSEEAGAEGVKADAEDVGTQSVIPAAMHVKTDAEAVSKHSMTPTAVAMKKGTAGAKQGTQTRSKETHSPDRDQGEAVTKASP